MTINGGKPHAVGDDESLTHAAQKNFGA